MGHQLDLVLPLQDGAFHVPGAHVDPNGGEEAGVAVQAGVSAGAEFGRHDVGAAVRSLCEQDALDLFGILVAHAPENVDVRFDPEFQDVVRGEQWKRIRRSLAQRRRG